MLSRRKLPLTARNLRLSEHLLVIQQNETAVLPRPERN